MLNLYDREWKSFCIKDIFITEKLNGRLRVPTGSYIKKDKLVLGDIPRITVTSQNNGIYGFNNYLNNNPKLFSNFISVSFLGNAFYHSYKASLDMKVHCLKIKEQVINKYIAQFILVCLNMNLKHYSYGNQLSSTDLPNKRIMFPVDENGEPDYAFMEEYIKECEKVLLQKYRKYIENKRFLNCDVQPLSTLEWKEFFIKDIFTISPGKRLTKSDMDNGLIPFVGAIDSNNGITNWIGTPNCSFDKNVLGVNYNGSVVENFYHTYGCVFSDDVKRLHLKNYSDNQYVLLFLKTIILQQKSKYTYGYKFNGHRMERQKILLPINEQGEPDFIFMENYVKKQENLLLQNYIKYIERRIEE